jgi:hypothetical protein
MRTTSAGVLLWRSNSVLLTKEFSRSPWPVPSLGAGCGVACGALRLDALLDCDSRSKPLGASARALDSLDEPAALSAWGAAEGAVDEAEGADFLASP